MAISLHSIQVGLPREFDGIPASGGKPWSSAIFKQPVTGPLRLGVTGLAGDGQANLVHHGGPEKAVLAYAWSHYALWRDEWGQAPPPGAFGENFTLDGLDEAGVCLGDVYDVGTARMQVSEPRVPCWKLNGRLGRPDVLARVRETGRTGWYLRVLAEGEVAAGLALTLIERPHPDWPMARVNAVALGGKGHPDAQALAAVPALSALWRDRLASW